MLHRGDAIATAKKEPTSTATNFIGKFCQSDGGCEGYCDSGELKVYISTKTFAEMRTLRSFGGKQLLLLSLKIEILI